MENSEKEKASILAYLPTCALFLYLYFFQGLSFGLAKIVGFSLRANGVSYEQMAVYTLIGLPFAIKILYSCIVDSLYVQWIGRRKTWIITSQTGIACVLFIMGGYMEEWLANAQVYPITCLMFLLFLFISIQDVATDGWIITKLPTELKGLTGPIQSFGIQIGVLCGFSGLTKVQEFLSLPSFCTYLALVLAFSTCLIAVYAEEKKETIQEKFTES